MARGKNESIEDYRERRNAAARAKRDADPEAARQYSLDANRKYRLDHGMLDRKRRSPKAENEFLSLVQAERRRQTLELGYTLEHDLKHHTPHTLTIAAYNYLVYGKAVKAAAMMLAAIALQQYIDEPDFLEGQDEPEPEPTRLIGIQYKTHLTVEPLTAWTRVEHNLNTSSPQVSVRQPPQKPRHVSYGIVDDNTIVLALGAGEWEVKVQA